MTTNDASPLAKDKMKKAITAFSELVTANPQKSRGELLSKIVLKYDLSPLESEFLMSHFTEKEQT